MRVLYAAQSEAATRRQRLSGFRQPARAGLPYRENTIQRKRNRRAVHVNRAILTSVAARTNRRALRGDTACEDSNWSSEQGEDEQTGKVNCTHAKNVARTCKHHACNFRGTHSGSYVRSRGGNVLAVCK